MRNFYINFCFSFYVTKIHIKKKKKLKFHVKNNFCFVSGKYLHIPRKANNEFGLHCLN